MGSSGQKISDTRRVLAGHPLRAGKMKNRVLEQDYLAHEILASLEGLKLFKLSLFGDVQNGWFGSVWPTESQFCH